MDNPYRDSKWLGDYGELVARSFLLDSGYRILRTNWRPNHGGEIDIVCRFLDTLVFCEVKTRTSREFGGGLRAVNAQKRQLIRKGGKEWLRMMRDKPEYRYDVIDIYYCPGQVPVVNHYRNAFFEHERSSFARLPFKV